MLKYYFQGYADTILLATRFGVRHPQLGKAGAERAPYDGSGEPGRYDLAAINARPCDRARRQTPDADA